MSDRRICYDFMEAHIHQLEGGLPGDVADHAENCRVCGAMFAHHSKRTIAELRALWPAREPERTARESFQKACNEWHKTLAGRIYLYLGGRSSSRRAKWLGIPQWDTYKPPSNELSTPVC